MQRVCSGKDLRDRNAASRLSTRGAARTTPAPFFLIIL